MNTEMPSTWRKNALRAANWIQMELRAKPEVLSASRQ